MAIELSDEWKQAINSALADGFPTVWSSVGSNGQPYLSFFGTTQAYGDDALAIWMRTPERGFLQRIAENPQVSMLFRNPNRKLAMQVHGEARRVDDQAVKDLVYNQASEVEQRADPDRAGTAVVVEITRIIQRGEVVQSRD